MEVSCDDGKLEVGCDGVSRGCVEVSRRVEVSGECEMCEEDVMMHICVN